MLEWWSSLSVLMKVLWGMTLCVSLVFVIETIMTFVGMDGASDFDTDFGGVDADGGDGGGTSLLSFRNFINFFLGFGWTAVSLHDTITSVPLLVLASTVSGVILVAVVMMLFKWLSGMQQSGNIDVRRQAVGCEGKVYLKVPASRQGEGKVQITINNSVREYSAVTDGGTLPTGVPIRVVDVISADTVLVEESESVII